MLWENTASCDLACPIRTKSSNLLSALEVAIEEGGESEREAPSSSLVKEAVVVVATLPLLLLVIEAARAMSIAAASIGEVPKPRPIPLTKLDWLERLNCSCEVDEDADFDDDESVKLPLGESIDFLDLLFIGIVGVTAVELVGECFDDCFKTGEDVGRTTFLLLILSGATGVIEEGNAVAPVLARFDT